MRIQRFALPLAAFLLACTAGNSLRAAEEESSSAQLIKLMDFSNVAKDQAKAVFTPVLDQFRKQGLPEEAIKEIEGAANRFFQKTFDDPKILVEMAKVYQKHYTEDEIKELLAFYATPIGKKSLKTLPLIMADSNKIGVEFATKNQGSFQQEMKDIIAKYQKSAPGGSPIDETGAEEEEQAE